MEQLAIDINSAEKEIKKKIKKLNIQIVDADQVNNDFKWAIRQLELEDNKLRDEVAKLNKINSKYDILDL